MVWETLTGDILIQDGTGAFLFTAGGTIYQGQQVFISADNTVKSGGVAASHSDCAGVALYDATVGEEIAIAGPGNIVYGACDAAIAPGTLVYGDTDGVFDATAGNAKKVGGIIVESSNTAITASNYKHKILLL